MILLDQNGETEFRLSLKVPTATYPDVTSAVRVEDVDWIRFQATAEESGTSWDGGTLKLQFSLDGRHWYDSGTTLSADGISSKVDVIAMGFVRLAQGTAALSTSPKVKAVIYGGNQS